MKKTALIKKAAIGAAKEAGRILLDGMTQKLTITYKGELDLVTQMDTLSEQSIVTNIKTHFPDHQILAEEGNNHESDSPYRWVIDPLDGTTNYAHRFPCFCVSIAVEYEGSIAMGVIYDPIRKELFFAEKGKGATLNRQPLSVSSRPILKESLLVTGFAYNLRDNPNNNLNHFSRLLMKAQGIRRLGSAALDLCYVAAGRLDGFWELNLKPWDTAAGFLILTEAGGSVTNFAGEPFSIDQREILATNGKIHQEMVDVLTQGEKSYVC